MTVLSDELVELAMLRAYAADPTVSYVSPGAVRAAIEAVLPDIERPWQEKIERLEKLVHRDREALEEARQSLVERDREIKRLQASVNEQLARANERTVAVEAQLAACQFSDAEREALRDGLDCLSDEYWTPNPTVRMSARVKLEQAQ